VSDPAAGRALVRFARARIHQELGGPPAIYPDHPWGRRPGAAFVTLRWPDGPLHGCVGNLEPRRSLVHEVAAHAVAAAFRDPRSTRTIGPDDVAALEVEISVLGPIEPLRFHDERSARAALRPGLDGVVIEWRGRRATFLPQMWSRLETAAKFLAALKEKAGLSPDFWTTEVRLWRYEVEIFTDAETP
jgi:hypothetical protein